VIEWYLKTIFLQYCARSAPGRPSGTASQCMSGNHDRLPSGLQRRHERFARLGATCGPVRPPRGQVGQGPSVPPQWDASRPSAFGRPDANPQVRPRQLHPYVRQFCGDIYFRFSTVHDHVPWENEKDLLEGGRAHPTTSPGLKSTQSKT